MEHLKIPAHGISIHALLTESDVKNTLRQIVDRRISIHALLTESDGAATNTRARHWNFYPRSPYGERPTVLPCVIIAPTISIHALLTESDCTL